MFTGIIETIGYIKDIQSLNGNLYFQIESPIGHELKIDQSVAHNGICLTVTDIQEKIHTVCAVPETISKTSISTWKIDDKLNIERCLAFNGRLDGHLVQGHVDTISKCLQRIDKVGTWHFTFELKPEFAHLMVEKGSITVNGISLTCFHVTNTSFEVAIIPYTFEHTSIHTIQKEDLVNLEFDIIGKYVARSNALQAK